MATKSDDDKYERLMELIRSNDRRYNDRFESADKVTQVAIAATKEAANIALQATKDASAAALTANDKAVNSALASAKEAVGLRLAASEAAALKAESSQRSVNANQNEFRGQLKDQAATLATKEVVDLLDRRLQAIERGAVTKEMHDAWGLRLSNIEMTFISRNLFDSRLESHEKSDKAARDAEEKRILALETDAAESKGKTSVTTVLWALAGSTVVALIIGFVSHFLAVVSPLK